MSVIQTPKKAIHFSQLLAALLVLMFCFQLEIKAQQSVNYVDEYVSYREALDLFDKEKYGPAQEKFSQAMTFINNTSSEAYKDAKYLHAICAIELFHADAEALLVDFIHQYPESKNIKQAYFNLGKFEFRKKRYDDAIEYFDKIVVSDLEVKQQPEYYFKKGYSCYCRFSGNFKRN